MPAHKVRSTTISADGGRWPGSRTAPASRAFLPETSPRASAKRPFGRREGNRKKSSAQLPAAGNVPRPPESRPGTSAARPSRKKEVCRWIFPLAVSQFAGGGRRSLFLRALVVGAGRFPSATATYEPRGLRAHAFMFPGVKRVEAPSFRDRGTPDEPGRTTKKRHNEFRKRADDHRYRSGGNADLSVTSIDPGGTRRLARRPDPVKPFCEAGTTRGARPAMEIAAAAWRKRFPDAEDCSVPEA